MSEEFILPDGITFNNADSQEINLDLSFEKINDTKCNKCDIMLEAVLITNFGRHEGIIRIPSNDNTVWKNSLPKDRVRSIKILNEKLSEKLDKHKERHKND